MKDEPRDVSEELQRIENELYARMNYNAAQFTTKHAIVVELARLELRQRALARTLLEDTRHESDDVLSALADGKELP